ncbi:MAG TPA: hypothetical protein RMH99_12520 [Sandaracinaceae bacterium LLY-WYZ-13_1]|nr:hypothetical protein [Sandaracinaceae bacterium LLY-WYZ-13_1]
MTRTRTLFRLLAALALVGCNGGLASDEAALVTTCRDFCQANIDACEPSELFSGGSRDGCASLCQRVTDENRWAGCTNEWAAAIECSSAGDPCDWQTRCDIERGAALSCIEEYCAANPDDCELGRPTAPSP